MFPGFYVPRVLYSPGSIFPGFYSPRVLCVSLTFSRANPKPNPNPNNNLGLAPNLGLTLTLKGPSHIDEMANARGRN